MCSSLKNEPVPPELKGLCAITLGKKGKTVKVLLKAQTSKINVGGYTVETENYNGNYLPPVIKAAPGDTVAARLENVLKDRPLIDHQPVSEPSAAAAPTQAAPRSHAHKKGNPTNLHYFHGGVVTPRNARSKADPDASKGDGDNVYVTLMNGPDEPGKRPTEEYNVPIPEKLHAGVLEGTTAIPHPNGLNWYHSHMHGNRPTR